MRCFSDRPLAYAQIKPFSAAAVFLPRVNGRTVYDMLKARLFPSVPIYGGSHQSPALTQLAKGGDQFSIGKTLNVESIFSLSLSLFPLANRNPTQPNPWVLTRCLATPCHTQDSICYYVTDPSKSAGGGAVFTGDTLFIAGCGVFFEGTGAEMHAAFQRLSALPDTTVTYVGHEYTAGNLRFALSVDPGNPALARLRELVTTQPVTVGRTTIGDEKEWNVFWRLSSEPVRYVIVLNLSLTPLHTECIHAILSVSPPHIVTCRAATKSGLDASPGETMDKLRTLKNNFKG